VVLQGGNAGTSVIAPSNLTANVSTSTQTASYDYVLKIVSQYISQLQVRLRAFSPQTPSLSNCTISLRNNTVYPQICVNNGDYTSQYGTWVGLSSGGTDYILITFSKRRNNLNSILPRNRHPRSRSLYTVQNHV